MQVGGVDESFKPVDLREVSVDEHGADFVK